MLAFSVTKLKLEYPLALHQNLAKKPCQPFIAILSAASLVGVRRLGEGVADSKQEVSAMSGTTADCCVATDLLRRGAACCARCSRAHSTAAEQATHGGRVVSCLGFQLPSNCDKLNRQTREFKNAVTYRKQTTANLPNRQNIQFCPTAFLGTFQPCATSTIPLRNPRA